MTTHLYWSHGMLVWACRGVVKNAQDNQVIIVAMHCCHLLNHLCQKEQTCFSNPYHVCLCWNRWVSSCVAATRVLDPFPQFTHTYHHSNQVRISRQVLAAPTNLVTNNYIMATVYWMAHVTRNDWTRRLISGYFRTFVLFYVWPSHVLKILWSSST